MLWLVLWIRGFKGETSFCQTHKTSQDAANFPIHYEYKQIHALLRPNRQKGTNLISTDQDVTLGTITWLYEIPTRIHVSVSPYTRGSSRRDGLGQSVL